MQNDEADTHMGDANGQAGGEEKEEADGASRGRWEDNSSEDEEAKTEKRESKRPVERAPEEPAAPKRPKWQACPVLHLAVSAGVGAGRWGVVFDVSPRLPLLFWFPRTMFACKHLRSLGVRLVVGTGSDLCVRLTVSRRMKVTRKWSRPRRRRLLLRCAPPASGRMKMTTRLPRPRLV